MWSQAGQPLRVCVWPPESGPTHKAPSPDWGGVAKTRPSEATPRAHQESAANAGRCSERVREERRSQKPQKIGEPTELKERAEIKVYS